LIIILIIILYIFYLIKKLLRNIIHTSDYNLIKVDRLVLVLNISSKNNRFHYIELIKLIKWKIRNFLSETNSIL